MKKQLSDFRVAQIKRLLTEYARHIEFELAEITEAADVTLADIADATDALNDVEETVSLDGLIVDEAGGV